MAFVTVPGGTHDDSTLNQEPLAQPLAVLTLHANYSRRSVHSIFSPETNFVAQAGTWGLQGIVDVPHQPGDYVFFVTFGQTQGDHHFDEFVTDTGVLSWQSQPQQGFNSKKIKNFVIHDEQVNNIHLFLRAEAGRDYTYFGRLKYKSHDPNRERPVYFEWDLLDGPPPPDVAGRAKLVLKAGSIGRTFESGLKHVLSLTAVPPGRSRGMALTTQSGRNRTRQPDYIANQIANQKLGLLGELLVIKKERERLTAAGFNDLAAKVRHVSVAENDTAGYDILSFDNDGGKRFIEVKTTRGSADADFFMSLKELAFAASHARNYYLYRVYDYVDDTDSAKYFVLDGDVRTNGLLTLLPTNYKISMKAFGE